MCGAAPDCAHCGAGQAQGSPQEEPQGGAGGGDGELANISLAADWIVNMLCRPGMMLLSTSQSTPWR